MYSYTMQKIIIKINVFSGKKTLIFSNLGEEKRIWL